MIDGLQCEVCRKEPAVGVACVPGIPYSAAYGRECIRRGANPYGIIRANVACCGGPDEVVPEYLEIVTYVDGEYMTLRVALLRHPMVCVCPSDCEIHFGPER